ncbi:MAG: ArnT family glycosyltransferase [bacterium]
MKKYLADHRWETFILASAFLMGVWVRTAGLSQGRFLSSDELRTTNRYSLKSPFLNLAYKPPLLIWGNFPDTALYTSAFWGSLGILAVFAAGKSLFNDKVGSYAAFLLSPLALHVRFSRTAFAAVFQAFILLIAFWMLLLYLKEYKRGYILVSGITLGLAFATYASSFAAITACFILLPLILKQKGLPLKKILSDWAVFGGAALFILLSTGVIIDLLYKESYWRALYEYKDGTALYAGYAIGRFNLSAPFAHIGRIAGEGENIQLGIMIWGLVYGIGSRKKDRRLIPLVGFIALSFIILSLTVWLGFQSLPAKRYLFLLPFLCISAAHSLYRLELATNEYPVIGLLALFLVLSLPGCLSVIRSTYKIIPVTRWLQENRISKDRIITRFDIAEKGDIRKTVLLPGRYIKRPFSFKIDWKQVKEFHRRNKVRYLLTSGLGYDAIIGFNDPVLKKARPGKVWRSPYHRSLPARGFTAFLVNVDQVVQDIALYDLNEIFTHHSNR